MTNTGAARATPIRSNRRAPRGRKPSDSPNGPARRPNNSCRATEPSRTDLPTCLHAPRNAVFAIRSGRVRLKNALSGGDRWGSVWIQPKVRRMTRTAVAGGERIPGGWGSFFHTGDKGRKRSPARRDKLSRRVRQKWSRRDGSLTIDIRGVDPPTRVPPVSVDPLSGDPARQPGRDKLS